MQKRTIPTVMSEQPLEGTRWNDYIRQSQPASRYHSPRHQGTKTWDKGSSYQVFGFGSLFVMEAWSFPNRHTCSFLWVNFIVFLFSETKRTLNTTQMVAQEAALCWDTHLHLQIFSERLLCANYMKTATSSLKRAMGVTKTMLELILQNQMGDLSSESTHLLHPWVLWSLCHLSQTLASRRTSFYFFKIRKSILPVNKPRAKATHPIISLCFKDTSYSFCMSWWHLYTTAHSHWPVPVLHLLLNMWKIMSTPIYSLQMFITPFSLKSPQQSESAGFVYIASLAMAFVQLMEKRIKHGIGVN